MRSAADVAAAAQLACLLEASAPKPGNVSPGRPFADARYEDFLASAVAIGEPLAGAGTRRLGSDNPPRDRSDGALDAVEHQPRHRPARRAARARGALHAEVGGGDTLRAALRGVLAETNIDDARDVYAAIRLAAPGGLGRAAEQDVQNDPTVTLLDAMRLAADRDGIAREYADSFEATFEIGAPALERARADELGWSEAVVETFLTLLAARPDTHIARRGGAALAAQATRLAAEALAEGGVRSATGLKAIDEMDRVLRDERHLGNPGTTADLTAASIFVVLLSQM